MDNTEENKPEAREIRITDHTKIRNLVAFSLKCLTESPRTAIMLHTLPHSAKPREHLQTEEPVTKKEKLASSTANIPRLVSVTEIIKREFATLVAANKGGPHNPPGALLYQYNMVGTLPDHRMESAEEVDPMVVLQALEGKSHLRRTSTPYMKVYLSTYVRDDLLAIGATYQASPPPPKKSRSSRARAKKRLEKEKAAQKVE